LGSADIGYEDFYSDEGYWGKASMVTVTLTGQELGLIADHAMGTAKLSESIKDIENAVDIYRSARAIRAGVEKQFKRLREINLDTEKQKGVLG